jgi:hypothetical protein
MTGNAARLSNPGCSLPRHFDGTSRIFVNENSGCGESDLANLKPLRATRGGFACDLSRCTVRPHTLGACSAKPGLEALALGGHGVGNISVEEIK